jgi:protein-tyrosine phosphatase
MIDLHAHILPEVDDGPADMDGSLKMVRMGWADGIHTICATPHLLEAPNERCLDLFFNSYQLLRERIAAEGLPVNLVLGAEVYFQADMERVLSFPRLSLNGTGKYLLVEFPMHVIPPGAEKIIFNLIMGGIVPIIAHPERNISVLRDEAVLTPFMHSGALIQVNAGSIEGHFGRGVKKTAFSLLRKGLVHLIGSDAHDAGDRPVRLRAAVECAADIIGQESAQLLVTVNPERILAGEPPLSIRTPAPEIEERRLLHKVWRGITGK